MNKPTETPIEALDRAIKVCGSQIALASAIGVSDGAPSMWKNRKKVPAEHCPAIERETKKRGAPVYCEQLNPSPDWAVLREQSAPC